MKQVTLLKTNSEADKAPALAPDVPRGAGMSENRWTTPGGIPVVFVSPPPLERKITSDPVPVMLCTDSGGDGKNLQFADTLVNYDLPWNPMRIEQRVGRLHRIAPMSDQDWAS